MRYMSSYSHVSMNNLKKIFDLFNENKDSFLDVDAAAGSVSMTVYPFFRNITSIVDENILYSPSIIDNKKNNNLVKINIIKTFDIKKILLENINDFDYVYLHDIIERGIIDFTTLENNITKKDYIYAIYMEDGDIKTKPIHNKKNKIEKKEVESELIVEKEEIEELLVEEVEGNNEENNTTTNKRKSRKGRKTNN